MARQVMELLKQINRDGATIVMVTHDAELARRAPRNIQVVDGQLADFTLYQGAQNLKKRVRSRLWLGLLNFHHL